ncbi:MAG: 30S ribosomal protein S16 [Planctomycetes bacterium]|nr:30S ribosomal protein S16 [Planctomycetota bacterium]
MAVRIRLTRAGRRHLPFYHVNIFDIRQRRNGACIERIGFYDPINKDAAAQISVDTEKAAYWLSKGALPSETVASILKKAGVELPERKKKAKTRKAKASKKVRKVKERTKKRTANSKARKALKDSKE